MCASSCLLGIRLLAYLETEPGKAAARHRRPNGRYRLLSGGPPAPPRRKDAHGDTDRHFGISHCRRRHHVDRRGNLSLGACLRPERGQLAGSPGRRRQAPSTQAIAHSSHRSGHSPAPARNFRLSHRGFLSGQTSIKSPDSTDALPQLLHPGIISKPTRILRLFGPSASRNLSRLLLAVAEHFRAAASGAASKESAEKQGNWGNVFGAHPDYRRRGRTALDLAPHARA